MSLKIPHLINFLLFVIITITSCSVFKTNKGLKMPGGRYVMQCDLQRYHALTFDGYTFKEEKQAPHLGNPVYYGNGTYQRRDSLLILHYNPFPEDFALKTDYYRIDTFDSGHHFKVSFGDIQSGVPIPGADIMITGIDGETIFSTQTGTDENTELSLTGIDEFHFLLIRAIFYPEVKIRLNGNEGDLHVIKAHARAGFNDIRDSGYDTLRIDHVGQEFLKLAHSNNPSCEYEKRAVEDHNREPALEPGLHQR